MRSAKIEKDPMRKPSGKIDAATTALNAAITDVGHVATMSIVISPFDNAPKRRLPKKIMGATAKRI